ncbi:MAG: putative transport system solute-binding protein [Fibrobacteres bacterium]|nr:putative transport system solute-binding protein [Fibrobacterota bacterium]
MPYRLPHRFRPLAVLLATAFLACTPSRKNLGSTYRGVLISNIKNFDPALVQDQYSSMCQFQVYETLLEYKYLARPYDVQPCLASAAPAISDSGKVFVIRIKKGVEFADDACFPGGKGREVKAADFVYSIKRMCDVRTQTTGWWIFDGKVVGLDAFRKATESLPPLPEQYHPALYDGEVEGLRALDDTTVRLELTKPYPYFKYILAMPYAAVVPHEAVEYYREDFMNHPVGTGPFLLKEWRRGLRLVFERNPKYHHGFYPTEGMPEDSAEGLLADAGKPLPFLDRVELDIFEELQPMWLNFLRGNLDNSIIPKDNYAEAVTPDKSVRGDLAAKGIKLFRQKDLDLVYMCFNFEDPVLGKHKRLRQAMSLAFDADQAVELFYNGRGVRAHSPIPPGLFGYDPAYKNPHARYDPEAAKALLVQEGFPGGKGLPEFEYLTVAASNYRQMGEHFAQCMARIGVKIKVSTCTWPEYLSRLKQKKVQIIAGAWGADYPDPENFLQLLYGPNESPGENNANYKNAEYDSLYREMAIMQDGPERKAKIRRMQDILAEDCPMIPEIHRLRELLIYDWVGDHRGHAVLDAPIKYYRIDAALRRSRLEGRGK